MRQVDLSPRRIIGKHLTKREFNELINGIQATNDRMVVLLLGALVERELAAAIKSRMARLTKQELKQLFDPGPLNSFDAKIKIARALAIIGRGGFVDLDIIRQIRNICAHAIHEVSFKTATVRRGIKQLRTPNISPRLSFKMPWKLNYRVPKDRFVYTCIVIWVALRRVQRLPSRPRGPRHLFLRTFLF